MVGEGRAERVHEGRVPGQFVCTVEHDGDHGSVRRLAGRGAGIGAGEVAGKLAHAVGGHGARRLEALAGEEDRVGQEAGQLAQVLRAALAQVAERLGGHARGHRGQCHQFGVRAGLAAQGDQRRAAGGERGHAVRPGLPAAEQAQQHQVGSRRQARDLVDRGPRGVSGQVAGPGSRGRQQFGVSGGNQENGEHLTDTAMRGDSELGGHSQPGYRVTGVTSKNADRLWPV